ncbi:MAG: hypothetical protein OXE79_11010 [Acidimicrobiaceae bacterium]|nr:hypothetical protein [Acidimicrobiaceae bacterium]MCY4280868.1 hypothetical protein [Acidimicrobiaceae bacterium]
MAATHSQMSFLYHRMTESMGEEAAELLLDQLPPGGWDQMSTKSDLVELRGGIKGDFADLKTDFADLKTDFADLKGDFADLKTEMADLKSLVVTGFAEAAVERAKIIKGQARQLYMMVSAMALFSLSTWVAIYIAFASG